MRKYLTALTLAGLAAVSSGCLVDQQMWAPCDPAASPFGTDGTYVLHCRDGRWTPIMTVAEYVSALRGEPYVIGPLPAPPEATTTAPATTTVPTTTTTTVPTTTTTTVPTTTTTTTVDSGPSATLVLHAGVDVRSISAEFAYPNGQVPTRTEVSWNSGSGAWSSQIVSGDDASITGLVSNTTYSVRARPVDGQDQPLESWSNVETVRYFETTLPVLNIDTDDAPILDKENYVDGSVNLDPNGSGVAAYTGGLEIRGRGNSTWSFDKKPYRVKLASKAPLMGMPSNRHWVLLANWSDRSHLRSQLMSEFGQAADGLDWTPQFRPVEVILNGRYDGVYLLGQHVRIDADRIDIDSMDESDIAGDALTGGYHLEYDWRWNEGEGPGFWTSALGQRWPFAFQDPEEPTQEQLDYIRDYVDDFLTALYAEGGPNPAFRDFLDTDSYIDWYLIQELTRNQDDWFSSLHMYKPRNGRLHFGPLWDFDLSMGSEGVFSIPSPAGVELRTAYRGFSTKLNIDPQLRTEIRDRWTELRPAFAAIVSGIDSMNEPLADAKTADAQRWNYVDDARASDTPEFLAAWLTAQMELLDREL